MIQSGTEDSFLAISVSKTPSRFTTFDPEPSYHTRDLGGGAGGDGGGMRWCQPHPSSWELNGLWGPEVGLSSLASLMGDNFQASFSQLKAIVSCKSSLDTLASDAGPKLGRHLPRHGQRGQPPPQLSLPHQCVSRGVVRTSEQPGRCPTGVGLLVKHRLPSSFIFQMNSK